MQGARAVLSRGRRGGCCRARMLRLWLAGVWTAWGTHQLMGGRVQAQRVHALPPHHHAEHVLAGQRPACPTVKFRQAASRVALRQVRHTCAAALDDEQPCTRLLSMLQRALGMPHWHVSGSRLCHGGSRFFPGGVQTKCAMCVGDVRQWQMSGTVQCVYPRALAGLSASPGRFGGSWASSSRATRGVAGAACASARLGASAAH